MTTSKSKQTCCPQFDPKTLDNKTHIWKDKLFVTDNVVQFFHMPLNMGQVITRLWQKIELVDAKVDNKDFLMLAYDPSPWKSDIYMTVSKEVPNAVNTKISGTFYSKVFDGPYNHVPKWIKQMDATLAMTGKQAKKYYFYYTYCPKCTKKFGHNYVVAFAQL